jgi:hypothetical protein
MGDFYRVDLDNSWSFVRGPARLLVANINAAHPTQLNQLITLASGATQYDAASAWSDLGATKGGVQNFN